MTITQRFGGALNLNIHVHALVIDGVFDATLAEIRDILQPPAALCALWLEIDLLRLTVKKTVHGDEQRRPDVTADRGR